MIAPAEWVQSRGGCYAAALGIDLSGTDANERFNWFIAAVLYGARISETLANRTWREFANRGVLTPQRILETGWEGVVNLLDAGGYVRYDYKTATKLITLCTHLINDFAGSLDAVHAAARDPRDLENRLKALAPGIGEMTVAIFLRELRGIWPKAEPALSPLAILAAQALGYLDPDPIAPEAALQRLKRVWAAGGQEGARFADFESALVREGLRLRRWANRRAAPSSKTRFRTG